MRARNLLNKSSGQLRWVVILLAIAVVLPTVCLLWFMSQAVKNERLAVRQKLVTVYERKLVEAVQKTNSAWSESYKFLDEKKVEGHPYRTFVSIVGEEGYDGLIIYDAERKRIYPLLSAEMGKPIELAEEFGDAWGLEFAEQKLVEAIKVYEQKALSGGDYVRLTAVIGKSRCLFRLGRLDEAIKVCKEIALSDTQNITDSFTLVLISNARLLLLEFLGQAGEKYSGLFEETFERLALTVYATNEVGMRLPADNNLFIAEKILEIVREKPFLEEKIERSSGLLGRLAAGEERSIRIAESFATAGPFDRWQANRVRRLEAGEEVIYGCYHKVADGTLLVLFSEDSIVSAFGDYEKSFRGSDVVYRIVDGSSGLVAGVGQVEGEPFVTTPIGRHFPGWRTELYFKDGDVFEKAASRQVAVYTWAGVLVIVLILGTGGFAGQVVNRQIKLNKMKNDFIATVSHELKTPLASIRVLVDTLLEGNYKDQKQAAEYLQLTSKENERLSRLIDNFLTFSRMERNKQAFDIVRTSPGEIAELAAEAMQTKFNHENCKLTVTIDKNLPSISADKDAMVTVLVNLLDNAYKYSYDDKQIELRVFGENSYVCFLVKDNGIGMTRRQMKRVFDRFYQADSSLTRRAEGTGLGLSIVKFIVDAHKGKITVESKPGKGSEFKVKFSG